MEDCVSAGLALEMDFIAGSRWRPRGQNLKRLCTFNKDVWHHREHTQLILSFPLSSSTLFGSKELKKKNKISSDKKVSAVRFNSST